MNYCNVEFDIVFIISRSPFSNLSNVFITLNDIFGLNMRTCLDEAISCSEKPF